MVREVYEMIIVNRKLDELKPYEKNPRYNDEAVKAVANSIRTFGFKVPMVIDSNNVIVCGHTRYKAAKQLNLAEVPCVIADDLSEEQIKAFRLADNQVSEIASWDDGLLEQELSEIHGIDMNDFGFDFDLEALGDVKVDLDTSLEGVADGENTGTSIYEPAESRPGEIYQMGKSRIMCGDVNCVSDLSKLFGIDLSAIKGVSFNFSTHPAATALSNAIAKNKVVYLMELEPKRVDECLKKYEELTGFKAQKIGGDV